MPGEEAEELPLGPGDAANDNQGDSPDGQTINEIVELLGGALGGILAGDLDEDGVHARSAEAEALFAQLSEEGQAHFEGTFRVQLEQGLGLLMDRDPDRHEEAVEHFVAALEAAEKARDELGPIVDEEFNATLKNNVLAARLQLAQSNLRTARGEERKRLQIEVASLQNQLKGPFAKITVLFRQLAEAVPLFGEATRLLREMDLERAAETISRAKEKSGDPATLLAELKSQALEDIAPLADVIERSGMFYTGFDKLIEATQLYIRAHRDAVLGNAQQAHVKQLERAESLIDEAQPELNEGGLVLSGMAGSELDLEGLESALDALRKNIVNLRRLVTAALLPKQQVRNAAPLLVLLFLITFLVSLFGLRLSGLVDDLGGVDLLAIVGFSLVVSFGGTFGATVGLSALSTVGGLFGKGKDRAPKKSEGSVRG